MYPFTLSIRNLVWLRNLPKLPDDMRLESAARRNYAVPVCYENWDTLFIHRDSMGISGIAGALTWEDAYGICEDEFFPEADETVEEMQKEYEPEDETPSDDWTENELFQEAYGFRPNGPNARDTHKHGIYAKDLNGDSLEPLTAQLCADLDIWLNVTPW